MTIETVLVAGATGRTGREVVDVLLAGGYRVRGHSTREAGAESLELQGCVETVVGDLRDAEVAHEAVDGVDAVVCCVGSSPTSLLKRPLVDDAGVRALAEAAADEGIERFVLESAIGVGDSKHGMPAPFRLAIRPIVQAKERGEAALRESGVPYVIVRPGRLTDGDDQELLVGEGGDTVSGTVSRRAVARLLVAVLTAPGTENRTFEVVSREGVRGTPRGLVELDARAERKG